MEITYISECDRDYARLLALQDTRAKLRKFLQTYRRVADDAYQVSLGMSLGDFRQFRDGLAQERRGKFAGENFVKRYGPVLMPRVLFEVSMIATEFHAPWGCAFLQMVKAGRIVEVDDVAKIVDKAAAA